MHRTVKNVIVGTVAMAIVSKVILVDAFVSPFGKTTLKYASEPVRMGIQLHVSSRTEPDEIFSEASIASSKASTFTPSPIENSSITDASGLSILPDYCNEDDTSDECVLGSEEVLGECLPERLVTLPRHHTTEKVDRLLRNTERILRTMHVNSTDIEMSQIAAAKEAGRTHERIYANNYVDLGKIDT
jgi:hypothetical protein